MNLQKLFKLFILIFCMQHGYIAPKETGTSKLTTKQTTVTSNNMFQKITDFTNIDMANPFGKIRDAMNQKADFIMGNFVNGDSATEKKVQANKLGYNQELQFGQGRTIQSKNAELIPNGGQVIQRRKIIVNGVVTEDVQEINGVPSQFDNDLNYKRRIFDVDKKPSSPIGNNPGTGKQNEVKQETRGTYRTTINGETFVFDTREEYMKFFDERSSNSKAKNVVQTPEKVVKKTSVVYVSYGGKTYQFDNNEQAEEFRRNGYLANGGVKQEDNKRLEEDLKKKEEELQRKRKQESDQMEAEKMKKENEKRAREQALFAEKRKLETELEKKRLEQIEIEKKRLEQIEKEKKRLEQIELEKKKLEQIEKEKQKKELDRLAELKLRQQQEEQRIKLELEKKRFQEEQDRLKQLKIKDEEERKRIREAQEKIRKEEEEKKRRESQERIRSEEEERKRREAQEKIRREEEDRKRREAEEKIRKEEEEARKKRRILEEEQRVKQREYEETQRKLKEMEIKKKREKELEEQNRLRKIEEEREFQRKQEEIAKKKLADEEKRKQELIQAEENRKQEAFMAQERRKQEEKARNDLIQARIKKEADVGVQREENRKIFNTPKVDGPVFKKPEIVDEVLKPAAKQENILNFIDKKVDKIKIAADVGILNTEFNENNRNGQNGKFVNAGKVIAENGQILNEDQTTPIIIRWELGPVKKYLLSNGMKERYEFLLSLIEKATAILRMYIRVPKTESLKTFLTYKGKCPQFKIGQERLYNSHVVMISKIFIPLETEKSVIARASMCDADANLRTLHGMMEMNLYKMIDKNANNVLISDYLNTIVHETLHALGFYLDTDVLWQKGQKNRIGDNLKLIQKINPSIYMDGHWNPAYITNDLMGPTSNPGDILTVYTLEMLEFYSKSYFGNRNNLVQNLFFDHISTIDKFFSYQCAPNLEKSEYKFFCSNQQYINKYTSCSIDYTFITGCSSNQFKNGCHKVVNKENYNCLETNIEKVKDLQKYEHRGLDSRCFETNKARPLCLKYKIEDNKVKVILGKSVYICKTDNELIQAQYFISPLSFNNVDFRCPKNIKEFIKYSQLTTCPRNCSYNGYCSAGKCICYDGWDPKDFCTSLKTQAISEPIYSENTDIVTE